MAITILRPNQEFTVKANVTRGDTQLVSWIIFNGHNSESMNILQFYPKNGVELNHHFPDEGKFRMAAYHKEIQTKEDFQGSAELKHVDVEIKYNQLDGSKLAPKNSGEFLAGDALRKDFPAVFEAKFLISPPSQEEINRLQFVLEDGSGNILNEGSHASNVFTFIPRNSNAKYTVKAIYTKESGEMSQQTFSGISKAISVRDITHGAEIVRPGTPMTFSITQTQFGSVSSNSNFPEQGNIKWNLDKVLIGTGRSVTISGNQLMQKKKYHIEAYATSAIGNTKGSNTDNTKNDWHFEVKDNIVENIKVVKKPKFGIEGEFEIGKMTFPNYDAAKDGNISWKITGPENGSGSEAKLKKLFSVPGEYTISCSLGGRECKEPLKINILQPEVTADKCKWIDRDNGSGNIIKEAGINQEVCAFVSGNALDNENLTLTVYDDDSTGRTSVYNMTFSTEDKHKTGFYLPITISQDVVDGIKKSGFADYGDLYFNIVRNGSELQVKNGDKKLGEFLRVSLEPKIINAYFCDANDTQQVFNSPLNGALYFKIYAINLVGRKAEINFVTESDAYWSWDDEMKIGPWEDIKNKFKNERIRDTKPGTFNEKGEILVPVDLSKMGKPKNFIRLNAMVKILPDENAKEKQEEKGFYMEYTNLAILFPGATLPTIAENKGAVKVGRENIDGGNNKTGECFCNRNFKPEELEEIVKQLRISRSGHNQNLTNLWYNQTATKMNDKTLKSFTDEINSNFNNFNIRTCAQKMHFLAQASVETGEFSLSREKDDGAPLRYDPYRGHGSLQLTHKETYEEYAKVVGSKIFQTPKLIAEDLHLTIHSGCWEWTEYKKMPKAGSDAVKKWGEETAGKSLNELAAYGDKYLELISALLNGRNSKTGMPNNWDDRESAYKLLRNTIFNYDYYHGNGSNNTTANAKDIVTFRIYSDGRIEKHIPKIIKNEYRNSYKYVFHDKDGNEHDICITEWHTTSKKSISKTKLRAKPTHKKIVSDKIVNEGQTVRRVIYENGDIAEYGSNDGDTFWRLYEATSDSIELVKMPEHVSYVNYSFSGTKRQYTGPNYFAGFIGALAITGLSVVTTGSCFKEGSCFPSQFHVNGESIDTIYFWNLQTDQKFINAMKFFHFGERKAGRKPYFKGLKNVEDGGKLHDTHLHSGEFNNSKVEVIREK